MSAVLAAAAVGLAIAGIVLADDADQLARRLTGTAVLVGGGATVVLFTVAHCWPPPR